LGEAEVVPVDEVADVGEVAEPPIAWAGAERPNKAQYAQISAAIFILRFDVGIILSTCCNITKKKTIVSRAMCRNSG